ncbi:putative 2-dehydropantoate 2-reductase [Calycomorphotria hydatis]|uniref:2-dehydropantoate 2-reductase n=1 Tax=Calycomorphotria hydatis TaxID=2528027 RepID=A0A517TA76_9PLAN|nr:putative 2-dehydropantoate 2-reductase [Calycomorphotria hydatis]QDT65282.1 2-dehydropantoate 2-reductase [Calycomorphotria hydatis]
MSNLSYAIVGTGALGGYYGSLLAKAGIDVHFLLNSDYEHVRDHGLKVESPRGDFSLPQVQCYRDVNDVPECDVVILGLKSTRNQLLPELLPPLIGPKTCVLVLQNGLDIEADTARVVGADRVLGGCCFLCSNKIGPGYIKHLDYGRIAFGEYAAEIMEVTPRMQAISSDLTQAGIENTPVADLLETRWKKLSWNVPFNGLSVAIDASTAEIMADESACQLAEGLMREVQASAKACGKQIEDAFLQKMLDDTRKMVPYDSSMRVDYQLKREMEVESIFGNPLRAAEAAGYTPRMIRMLYEQLKFLDRRNRK